MIKVRALVYSFGSNMVAKTRKRNGDRQKLHMLDFRLSFVSGLMNVGSSPEQRLVIEPKNSWDRPGAVNHCQYSQTYTVRKCFLRSVQFDRLFSVYFFSLFSFFKERSLSLSEQPQTHLICSYHVAKNVFHQGNCLRIKIKNVNLTRIGGSKSIFKITQYADVVDIKFSVQTVLANIINTRSTGRSEYFVRRKSQTNSF